MATSKRILRKNAGGLRLNQKYRDRLSTSALFVISSDAQKFKNRWSKAELTLWKIWLKLQDNQWHTAENIAKAIGKSQRYVIDVMRYCVKPWQLATSKTGDRRGYCLLAKNQPIIV